MAQGQPLPHSAQTSQATNPWAGAGQEPEIT